MKLALDLIDLRIAEFIRPHDPATAEYIEIFRDYFDIFNITYKNASSSPWGGLLSSRNYDTIIDRLDDIIEYTQKMRIQTPITKKPGAMQPFQKGIIMSCRSMRDFYKGKWDICML